jgi:hypothetical protein
MQRGRRRSYGAQFPLLDAAGRRHVAGVGLDVTERVRDKGSWKTPIAGSDAFEQSDRNQERNGIIFRAPAR